MGLCDLRGPPSAVDSGISKDPTDSSRSEGLQACGIQKICCGLFRTYPVLLTKGSILDRGVTASKYRGPQLSVCGGSVIDTASCEMKKGTVGET